MATPSVYIGTIGAVIRSPSGRSYIDSQDTWKNYSRLIKSGMNSWNPSIGWKPKDLRNCLPTFAVMEGIHGDVWEQYIGHAPKSVTARHYVPRLASVSIGNENALKRQMNLFRNGVVSPLEEAMGNRPSAEILNFFEHSAKG